MEEGLSGGEGKALEGGELAAETEADAEICSVGLSGKCLWIVYVEALELTLLSIMVEESAKRL